jgi:hypothetical protein
MGQVFICHNLILTLFLIKANLFILMHKEMVDLYISYNLVQILV